MKLKTRVLSEIKGEESLSIVGDIMAPIVELGTDEAIRSAFEAKGGNVAKALKIAIKKHSGAIYDMLSALSFDEETGKRVSRKDYMANCTPVMIMNQLTAALSDPPMQELFFSQSQTTSNNGSGSATENTAEEES